MAKKKRRYYDSYQAIKSHQMVTRGHSQVVNNLEVEEDALNNASHVVNKRKRSRVGFMEVRRHR